MTTTEIGNGEVVGSRVERPVGVFIGRYLFENGMNPALALQHGQEIHITGNPVEDAIGYFIQAEDALRGDADIDLDLPVESRTDVATNNLFRQILGRFAAWRMGRNEPIPVQPLSDEELTLLASGTVSRNPERSLLIIANRNTLTSISTQPVTVSGTHRIEYDFRQKPYESRELYLGRLSRLLFV